MSNTISRFSNTTLQPTTSRLDRISSSVQTPQQPPPALFGKDDFSTQAPPKPPFLDAVANQLGISADQLQTELQSGGTLNDVASAHGVSAEDLQATLAADIKQRHPELSDDQVSAISNRIASSSGPGAPPPQQVDETQGAQRPHRHHGGHRQLKELADQLGVDPQQLAAQVSSGSSLVDAAANLGVSSDQLQTALTSELQRTHPELSADDAAQLAQRIASEPPPPFRARDFQRRSITAD